MGGGGGEIILGYKLTKIFLKLKLKWKEDVFLTMKIHNKLFRAHFILTLTEIRIQTRLGAMCI